MAGKFANTSYNDTIKSVLNTQINAIKNPYYKWSDQPPTPVTYYNINRTKSTLDIGSEISYDNVGSESPFRYNKIENALIYGGLNSPISMQLENDEFGLAATSVEGEAYILPNTWVPTADDEFIVDYVKEKMVFRVIEASPDTLEDGTNFFKISYKTSSSDIDQLNKQTIESFKFVADNLGTQFNTVIRSETYDMIKSIDETCLTLKKYYKSIFYNNRVQAFTFKEMEYNFYDPYLTEFIKRNKLMDGDDQYIYIQHQTPLDKLFPVNYTKTFFHALEKKDSDTIHKYPIKAIANRIEYPYSIFMNRYEDYYEINWNLPEFEFMKQLQCFKQDLPYFINNKKLFKENNIYYNIIIKYFNGMDIDEYDLMGLDDIDYDDNIFLFYAIPCIIYCLEHIAQSMICITKDRETY